MLRELGRLLWAVALGLFFAFLVLLVPSSASWASEGSPSASPSSSPSAGEPSPVETSSPEPSASSEPEPSALVEPTPTVTETVTVTAEPSPGMTCPETDPCVVRLQEDQWTPLIEEYMVPGLAALAVLVMVTLIGVVGSWGRK